MNKITLLLAGLLALSSATVRAEQPSASPSYQAPTETGLTRAQVREELARARAAGELSSGDVDYPHGPAAASFRSRAEVRDEVRNEYLAARKAGRVIDRGAH